MSLFPRDLFAGTAEYYEAFRERYPTRLLEVLRAATARHDLLVDIACGNGQVAVPMAPHFERVIAVDQEPDMIEVGRRVGPANIDWQVGRAEELDLPARSVDMITIGSAFHRLDRASVADKARTWLRGTGVLVVMGVGPAPGREAERAPWRRVIGRTINEWAKPEPWWPDPVSHVDLLESRGYGVEHRELRVPHTWTLDELVGYAFSLSIASKRRLGDRAAVFEAALRSALTDLDPSGVYDEELSFFALIGRPDAG